MNRVLILIAAVAALPGVTSRATAAELELPRNGWASWEVPAVADAPAWCCYEWDGSPATKTTCKLDDKDHGYGNRDDAKTDTVRIYARFAAGKLERLRPLSADCPVQANSEIRKLSPSEQQSVEWLAGLLKNEAADDAKVGKRSRSEVLSALAVHRAALAYDVLARIARQDPRLGLRKDALFWLAHLRGRAGADLTTTLMFEDADAQMREHAAFALTQSASPRIAEDLTRLATTERAIDTALRKETDSHVREQAIFALSQLPEERATGALINVAENRSLSQTDRKRAIFWLAQVDSDSALTYLDKVVNAAAKR